MLVHRSVEHDARVRREARALAESGREVVVVQLSGQPPSDQLAAEPFRTVSAAPRRLRRRLPLKLHRVPEALSLLRAARACGPAIVHAHDVAMLPLAFGAGADRVVYDSHEFATGVPYRSRAWAALVATIERLLIRRADAVITVSPGIAELLQRRYRLAAAPTVLRNVPALPTGARAPDLRRELGIGDAPLILHQGAVARDRGCENLVRALALIDDAELLFLGAQGAYLEHLRRLADDLGLGGRVHAIPPVALDELVAHTSQADVGVSLLEDTCLNHRMALPNKVFEYIAAGLPVVTSRLPELERLLAEHPVGVTVDSGDPASIAAGVLAALEMRGEALSDRIGRAAAELSWERERSELTKLYSAPPFAAIERAER